MSSLQGTKLRLKAMYSMISKYFTWVVHGMYVCVEQRMCTLSYVWCTCVSYVFCVLSIFMTWVFVFLDISLFGYL